MGLGLPAGTGLPPLMASFLVQGQGLWLAGACVSASQGDTRGQIGQTTVDRSSEMLAGKSWSLPCGRKIAVYGEEWIRNTAFF